MTAIPVGGLHNRMLDEDAGRSRAHSPNRIGTLSTMRDVSMGKLRRGESGMLQSSTECQVQSIDVLDRGVQGSGLAIANSILPK